MFEKVKKMFLEGWEVKSYYVGYVSDIEDLEELEDAFAEEEDDWITIKVEIEEEEHQVWIIVVNDE